MVEVARARFLPAAESVRAARRFVAGHLRPLGLERRGDDVDLVVTELATNAVIHARTAFAVRLGTLPGGARIEVSDASTVLPAGGTLSLTALSGRGLTLVRALCDRWGADRHEPDGKTVWCELASGSAAQDAQHRSEGPAEHRADEIDALLAGWPDDDPPAAPDGAVEVVVPATPVTDLLAAKIQMEDLLREAHLVLVASPRAAAVPGPLQRLWLTVHELDEAATAFGEGRRQIRAQLVAARDAGRTTVALRLTLPPGSAATVARYRAAVDAVQQALRSASGPAGSSLTSMTGLRLLSRYDDVRRHYLDAVLAQLAAPGA